MDVIRKQALAKIGQTDYVQDGELHAGGTAPSIMVTAESDLAYLPSGKYPPGTVAFTAGFKAMWQLDAGGTWVSMV